MPIPKIGEVKFGIESNYLRLYPVLFLLDPRVVRRDVERVDFFTLGFGLGFQAFFAVVLFFLTGFFVLLALDFLVVVFFAANNDLPEELDFA